MHCFNQIGPDITAEIVSRLKTKERCQLARCDRYLSKVSSNELIWQKLYRAQFAQIPHLDMSYTWFSSYRETDQLLYSTATDLVTCLCIVNAKYFNSKLTISDVYDALIAFFE